MVHFWVAAVLGLSALSLASAAPKEEAIDELPVYGKPPAPQWSGFLDASAEEPGTMLHYWFAQASHADAEKMPVVLWLNGGPGSSSILGMLEEMGPLITDVKGGLTANPYAWTKQANVLILESPGGVGYSYCAAMKTGGNCKNTDISTAKAARAALQDFFKTKFPELRENEFYITGESYAGVYIPTLTKELLTNAKEVNIQGIAVGDPCTDTPSQEVSQNMLWYAHKNGFVPDDDYTFLSSNCSYKPSKPFLALGHWRREANGGWSTNTDLTSGPQVKGENEAKCHALHRRYLATTSKGISQGWIHAYINELDLYADASALDWDTPGTLDYYTAQWMRSDAVRKALHVESAPVKSWPGPSAGWEYTSSYDACNSAPPGTPSMIDFYREIAPELRRTIVFNGDTDPCVSYEGTRIAIEKVGFPVKTGGVYRPWFYDKTAASEAFLKIKPGLFGPGLELSPAGVQLGGQVVDYEHNLSFVTVHGSGHMVPQFQPQAAERLLSRLLTGEPFVAPLASDEDLLAMSEEGFNTYVDTWTIDAEKEASQSNRREEAVLV